MSRLLSTQYGHVARIRGVGGHRVLMHSICTSALALAAAGLGPEAACAQTPSATVLEEVVVTAEKRESTVQKTPISITALSGEELANSGVTSAQGIVQLAPNVAITSAGPGQATYEIRGLSGGGGESPTIGFYLDETPIVPPTRATTGKSEIDPDLYDLSRVEVLRGPQGTLYGAGSMGGTIKLITASPDATAFKGSAQSVLSGTQDGGLNYAERGMLNIPLVADKLALRVVGSFKHDSGWIDRVVVPNFPLETNPAPDFFGVSRGPVAGVAGSKIYTGVNQDDTYLARSSLLIRPTDRLIITPSIFFQKIQQDGPNDFDSVPGTLAHYQPADIAEPYSDRFVIYALRANYDLDAASLTSATSYWDRRTSQVQDESEVTQNRIALPFYVAVTGAEKDHTRQFSQEVRWASRGSGAFQWLFGGFYSNYLYDIDLGEAGPAFADAFGTATVVALHMPIQITQKAAFANLSYAWKALTFTAGARYFDYSDSSAGVESGFALTGSDAQEPLPVTHGHATGVNPLARLSYALADNFLLYGSAAKGFREGAGNVPVPTSGDLGSQCLTDLNAIGLTTAPSAYSPDSVWTYEAGEKGKLLDGRLTVNAGVFYTRWSKVQQPVALNCGIGFTANGADATIKGAELEIRARLAENFQLVQNFGYADAAYTDSFAGANVAKGDRLLDAPRWTINTSLQYNRIIASTRFFAAIVNSYQSTSYEITFTRDTIPARDLTNARIGLDVGRWTLALFANNLFNQIKPIAFQPLLLSNGPPYDRIAVSQPRTAGLDVSLSL